MLLLVISGTGIGRCGDADEIKRLKAKIAKLEAKLELAERKIQDLT